MKNDEYELNEMLDSFLPIGEMNEQNVIQILREIGDNETLESIRKKSKEFSSESQIDFDDLSRIPERLSEWKIT